LLLLILAAEFGLSIALSAGKLAGRLSEVGKCIVGDDWRDRSELRVFEVNGRRRHEHVHRLVLHSFSLLFSMELCAPVVIH